MVPSMMLSSRDMGPMAFSFSAAAAGASGVCFTSGGISLYSSSGVTARPMAAGTTAACTRHLRAQRQGLTPACNNSNRLEHEQIARRQKVADCRVLFWARLQSQAATNKSTAAYVLTKLAGLQR